MPNWCSTNIWIIGPKEEVQDFYEKSQPKSSHDRMAIIPTLYPCPEELTETTATAAYEFIPEDWAKFVEDGSWTQEYYDKRVSDNNELLGKQTENLAKHGAKDWYDWQYRNWGTKWGDCDTTLSHPKPYSHKEFWEITGYFQTAWGTATEAWEKISEKYPNCVFWFEHDEEAGFFAGVEIIRSGSKILDSMFAPCEYGEDIDWEDDEQVEKYEEWKIAEHEKCEKDGYEVLGNMGFIARTVKRPSALPSEKVEKTAEKPSKSGHFWS